MSVSNRACFRKLPRWRLIVWAYIKLFFANLLLVSSIFSWAGSYRYAEPIISISLATVVAILDLAVTAVFVYGCNKKNVKAIKIFHFVSQFFLGFVAALSFYEAINFIIRLFDIIWEPFCMWIYLVANNLILFSVLGVDICVFILLVRIIKDKKFVQDGPEAESLFKVENLYGIDAEPDVEQETLPYKDEKLKDAVLGA